MLSSRIELALARSDHRQSSAAWLGLFAWMLAKIWNYIPNAFYFPEVRGVHNE